MERALGAAGVKVLVFTNLWPSSQAPTHGSFVRDRIERLRARLGFDYRVIHPVPLYPPLPGDGLAARHSRLPKSERVDGIAVQYPRYFHVPGYGVGRQAERVVRGARRVFTRVVEELEPDLVDAHYLYPDGCAAIRLAREAGLRCIVTARGSDVNLLPRYPAVRGQIAELLPAASRVLAVSSALAERLREVSGLNGESVTVVPNGVDLDCFAPGATAPEERIVTVARLLPNKRVELLLRALAADPSLPRLVVIGGGPRRRSLEALAAKLGVGARVELHGECDRATVTRELARGGVFALASRHEGWPNAVMEALACGLRVVATCVGGLPEIIADDGPGTLLEREAGPDAWAGALRAALERLRADPAAAIQAARGRAEQLSWDRSLDRLEAIYAELT